MSPTELADAIVAATGVIARATTDRHFAQHPTLDERYGPAGRDRCTGDAVRHLQYLATSVRAGVPAIFGEYAVWTRSVLEGLGIPEEDLRDHLATLAAVVAEHVADEGGLLTETFAAARHGLSGIGADEDDSHMGGPHAEFAQRYLEALLSGDRAVAVGLVRDVVEAGTIDLEAVYVDVFQPCLREVGRLWQLNRISVAQEHFATAATQLAMSTLYPHIFARRGASKGRLLLACVGSELHEIGLRMVADVFELRSWDTHFIGANVPAASVVAAVREQRPEVIALSATLPPHVDEIRDLIVAIRDEGHTQPIVVGGRPFLQVADLHERVGADGTAPDAVAAVDFVTQLVS